MSATVPAGVRVITPTEVGAVCATVLADVGVIARGDTDTIRMAIPVGAGAVALVRPLVA